MNQVNPYHQEGSKKSQVAEMFNRISGSYDLLNSILSLGIDKIWRKRLIQSIPYSKEENLRFLDLAAGTCAISFEAAKAFPNSIIDAVDLSDGMLEKARKIVLEKKLEFQINLIQGDAEALNFESNTFDTVFIGFGVRNFENVEKGISEMFRVLKPGGSLLILEFSKPRITPFKQMFNLYFKYFLPLIGNLWSRDRRAYSYLFESVQQFPDYERFIAIMQQQQFKDCTFKPLTFGICTIYSAIK
ncbi:MAG: bifunctional demethylmenaquinone methyltransferase/2-methoxy-6-polyprenyl-1,4-benzoquinol methylase UbiE [Saprospiraceae bacterium]|nr:bifunctional demethylmenaquinone methyltransferase/2-methoxy-6-polyprenyl-1,4-benzoquinol methylase UbiE [Saprospiraceae bacterium]